jgi:hypothetical protein
MTVLGKVLVFLNFILSLAAASLFVFSYAARTNWKASYDKLDSEYKVAAASAKAYSDEVAEARRTYGEEARIAKEQTAAAKAELQVARDQLQQTQTSLTNANKSLADANTTIASNTQQKNLLAADNKKLEAAVMAKDEDIKKLLAVGNELKKEKVNADIARDGYKEMNEGLEKRVRELEIFVANAKKSGVVPVDVKISSENPPPEDIQGFVKRDADPTGLVLLSLGSDAGLAKGHTLEIFRLQPQGKYLGRVKIVEVRPYESVGQVIGKPTGPILKDDRVASKLLK